MPSDFQRKKLKRIFDLFDTDKNGFLEQSDYEAEARRVAELRGWSPGSAQFDEVQSKYKFVWNGIREGFDTNRDSKVSFEEWVTGVEKRAAEAQGQSDNAYRGFVEFVFNVFDRDADGALVGDDYVQFCQAYGIDAVIARATFAKLTRNDADRLSKDDVVHRVREFYQSTDPSVPGNAFFGPIA
jgi:hypothetical protein